MHAKLELPQILKTPMTLPHGPNFILTAVAIHRIPDFEHDAEETDVTNVDCK